MSNLLLLLLLLLLLQVCEQLLKGVVQPLAVKITQVLDLPRQKEYAEL